MTRHAQCRWVTVAVCRQVALQSVVVRVGRGLWPVVVISRSRSPSVIFGMPMSMCPPVNVQMFLLHTHRPLGYRATAPCSTTGVGCGHVTLGATATCDTTGAGATCLIASVVAAKVAGGDATYSTTAAAVAQIMGGRGRGSKEGGECHIFDHTFVSKVASNNAKTIKCTRSVGHAKTSPEALVPFFVADSFTPRCRTSKFPSPRLTLNQKILCNVMVHPSHSGKRPSLPNWPAPRKLKRKRHGVSCSALELPDTCLLQARLCKLRVRHTPILGAILQCCQHAPMS